MKLSQLRNFLAVAESGSVRAAARHLNLAQPALTRSIQELERELNAALFERGARGVRVTAMGERLLARARVVTNEVRRAHEEIAQLQGDAQGTLRVCLSTVPHIALFPYALKEFRARYPDMKLDVLDGVFPTAEARLRSGDLDCYVGPAPDSVPGAELVVETLFENTRVVVCRRGHPLREARSLAELRDAEWVSTSITFRPEEEMDPLFAHYGLPPPKRVLLAHSALTYITAVAYSDFLAMLPVQWAEFEVTRSAIDIIPVAEDLPAPPIRIVRRADLPLTPAAQYFSDMIRRASLHLEQRRAQARPAPRGR